VSSMLLKSTLFMYLLPDLPDMDIAGCLSYTLEKHAPALALPHGGFQKTLAFGCSKVSQNGFLISKWSNRFIPSWLMFMMLAFLAWQKVSSVMVAGPGISWQSWCFCGILGLTESKFSHDNWTWNEPDSLDALVVFLAWQNVSSVMVARPGISWQSWCSCGILALTESKFSHGGWTWNEPDSLDALVAFLAWQNVSSVDFGWPWNEPDSFDALVAFLAWQEVSSVIVVEPGMKLRVLILLWHSLLDRM
jgi:hypothetical protein